MSTVRIGKIFRNSHGQAVRLLREWFAELDRNRAEALMPDGRKGRRQPRATALLAVRRCEKNG